MPLKEDADTELLKAVRTIREGNRFISSLLSSELASLVTGKSKIGALTPRERQVAKLVAEGKSSKEIAELLYISVFTVRRHRESIMKKLDLKNVADLVRYALDHGYTFGDS